MLGGDGRCWEVLGGEGRLPQPCLAWRPIFIIIFSSSWVQEEMTWRNVVTRNQESQRWEDRVPGGLGTREHVSEMHSGSAGFRVGCRTRGT